MKAGNLLTMTLILSAMTITPLARAQITREEVSARIRSNLPSSEATTQSGLQSAERGEGSDGGPFSPDYAYGPEDFWIEILRVDATNQLAYLTLHGTTNGGHYQLEQTPWLEPQPLPWQLGEIITGAAGTNQTDFSAAPIATNQMTFYRAHHAQPIVSILAGNNAIEPGTPGSFSVDGSSISGSLTVYYSVAGTATNGTDYTSLSGTITLSPFFGDSAFGTIDVHPIVDGVAEGAETVTLKILRTNSYLITPVNSSATITISDSSPNLDYHLATNAVGHASGHTPSDTVQLANWSYAQYSGTDLALLTNAVWSTNFWLRAVSGLSATCIGFSNGLGGQFLLTMVSPRHYLRAIHVGTPGNPIAFLDTNNVIYWRTVLQQVDLGNDTAVGILNSDLPSSVGFLPVIPPAITNYLPFDSSWIQGIGMNQDQKLFSQPMAAYTFFNTFVTWDSTVSVPSGLNTNWNIGLRSGDSSNPEMFLIKNQLVLVSHNYTGVGGPNYAFQIDGINQKMHYLSTNNAAGSDYQLTLFSLTNFPTLH